MVGWSWGWSGGGGSGAVVGRWWSEREVRVGDVVGVAWWGLCAQAQRKRPIVGLHSQRGVGEGVVAKRRSELIREWVD